jgi:DNA (cytosine-5)-methyltransferase 1
MAVQQSVGRELRELALFAGAGGGILGGKLLGWRTVCAVEWDAYAASILVARQNDGCLPPFPIWDDVRTFEGRPWRGAVDVISGGFPCQDVSPAGSGAGMAGAKSGLWREFARIIGEVRPRFVFIENSQQLRSRGLHVVLQDLHAMGYDAAWGVLGADSAPVAFGGDTPAIVHTRDRMWVVARAHADGAWELQRGEQVGEERGRAPDLGQATGRVATTAGPYPDSERRQEQRGAVAAGAEIPQPERCSWWTSEPAVGRMADGMANRVDRLRCIGNGQVPAVAALAWCWLSAQLGEEVGG